MAEHAQSLWTTTLVAALAAVLLGCPGRPSSSGPDGSTGGPLLPAGCVDNDGDGFPGVGTCLNVPAFDCDDAIPTVFPLAVELCDGLDNDCDDKIDEEVDAGAPCRACQGAACQPGSTVCEAGEPFCVPLGAGIKDCIFEAVSPGGVGSGETVLASAIVHVEGLTDGGSQAPGVEVELALGPPDGGGSRWTYARASYAGEVGGAERYQATMRVAYTGARALGARMRLPDAGAWMDCARDAGSVVQVGPHADIAFCNLQFPATAATPADGGAFAYGQLYEPGVTRNPDAGFRAELGVGPADEDPGASTAWTWSPAPYNSAALPNNNNEYYSRLPEAPAGSYAFLFRYARTAGDGGYCYGDLDGAGKAGASLPWGGVTPTLNGASNIGRLNIGE